MTSTGDGRDHAARRYPAYPVALGFGDIQIPGRIGGYPLGLKQERLRGWTVIAYPIAARQDSHGVGSLRKGGNRQQENDQGTHGIGEALLTSSAIRSVIFSRQDDRGT